MHLKKDSDFYHRDSERVPSIVPEPTHYSWVTPSKPRSVITCTSIKLPNHQDPSVSVFSQQMISPLIFIKKTDIFRK